MSPRIALTLGEPAGIGADIAVKIAQAPPGCRLVVIGDEEVLLDRAGALGLPVSLTGWREQKTGPAEICLISERVNEPVTAGRLCAANAEYVLRCLDRAIDGCMNGEFDAMVTGPVHKGIINDAGIRFTGHTEYISQRAGGDTPVMMLATARLRVALATTHVPLADVSRLITRERLEVVLNVLISDLRRKFGLDNPRVAVCGLNPHAGEQGYLGSEDESIIAPVVEAYRQMGHAVFGPFPADTIFVPRNADRYDVVLAMYHDQGLPVIKHQGFEEAVNVTLGVPVLRTSVDHGTALELAGSGNIDIGSSLAAINLAADLAKPGLRH